MVINGYYMEVKIKVRVQARDDSVTGITDSSTQWQ